MPRTPDSVRDHLIRALDWEEAHVGFDKAIANVPPERRGTRAPGFEQTIWQLLEHLRIAQEDLLDFCVNPAYVHTRQWPDEYWPKHPGPSDDQAWVDSIAHYVRGREGFRQVVRDVDDLGAIVPTGEGTQTYFRSVMLVIDHSAYHVGQIVAVRRALGIW